MSETKFTPGPWRMLRDDSGGPFTGWPYVEAPPDRDAAIVHRAGFKQEYWGDLNQREALANAALIAAAPELYEALHRIVDTGFSAQAEEVARAALAKARGDA